MVLLQVQGAEQPSVATLLVYRRLSAKQTKHSPVHENTDTAYLSIFNIHSYTAPSRTRLLKTKAILRLTSHCPVNFGIKSSEFRVEAESPILSSCMADEIMARVLLYKFNT